ncbi:MAG: ElyC/SanA/YdcF family protein [Bacteroidota bacterium]|nr:ElyC/SanA/YdcF family protein [Bacteroidota bacterium]MDP3147269.1 ElyC/SanA/YdcF family protein [Bacteroidota bacterium]MDP3557357.1 ElyC/SanA/YdcF family protein [Bacteroidota bacterium]
MVVFNSTKNQLYNDVKSIPKTKVGIVLGTSRLLRNGTKNLYFSYRINAAKLLFESKKVSYLILSGDNRVDEYNEPKDMHDALIALGVPDSCLILDYAGLRTFDSMVRSKEVFGQDSIIVISQEFHNARAVYISNKIGLTAFGFNAQKVTTQQAVKIKFREYFSRTKCILDLYILNTKPKHLGKKIKIG